MNIKKLDEAITKLILNNEDYKVSFYKLGYIPKVCSSETGGGHGNEKFIWLDIEEFSNTDKDQELEKTYISIESIEYERTSVKDIKISLFARLFFRDNELKTKSVKGFIFIIFFLMIFFGLIALSILLIIIYLYLGTVQNSWMGLYSLFGMPILIYWFFVETLIPLHNLLNDRVIKVPHFVFLNINEDDADLELFMGNDG